MTVNCVMAAFRSVYWTLIVSIMMIFRGHNITERLDKSFGSFQVFTTASFRFLLENNYTNMIFK